MSYEHNRFRPKAVMEADELTERVVVYESNVAQVLILLSQSTQAEISQPREHCPVDSASAYEDTDQYISPMLSALEAKEAVSIYVQNTNFYKPEFMRLYKLIHDSLQISLNRGRGKKYKLAPLNLFFVLLDYLRKAGI